MDVRDPFDKNCDYADGNNMNKYGPQILLHAIRQDAEVIRELFGTRMEQT